MALFLVTCDMTRSDGFDYEPFLAHLATLKAIRFLASQWLLPSRKRSKEVYEELRQLLSKEDRVLVVEVLRDAHWKNLLVGDVEFRDLLIVHASRHGVE